MAKKPQKHKPKKGGKKRKRPNHNPCKPRRGTKMQAMADRHHQ